MDNIVYEEQLDGTFWSFVITMLIIAGMTILWIWSKIGQSKK